MQGVAAQSRGAHLRCCCHSHSTSLPAAAIALECVHYMSWQLDSQIVLRSEAAAAALWHALCLSSLLTDIPEYRSSLQSSFSRELRTKV